MRVIEQPQNDPNLPDLLDALSNLLKGDNQIHTVALKMPIMWRKHKQYAFLSCLSALRRSLEKSGLRLCTMLWIAQMWTMLLRYNRDSIGPHEEVESIIETILTLYMNQPPMILELSTALVTIVDKTEDLSPDWRFLNIHVLPIYLALLVRNTNTLRMNLIYCSI